MYDKGFHRCDNYDYVDLGSKEFLLFCPECKRALGVVSINLKDKLRPKHEFDAKTIEELR